MKEIDTENVMKAIRSTGDQLIERIELVHGPYWNSRLDIVKTVLGLTSAILVGTIAFSSSLAGPNQETINIPCLLFTSWFLLFSSLCAATFNLWHMYKLRAVHPNFFNKSNEITDQLNKVSPKENGEDLLPDIMNIMATAVRDSVSPSTPSDRFSHYGLAVQLISFTLGLFMFLFFGMAQHV